MSPDSRPEAAPDDVARWCEAVKTMPADELGTFERQTRRAFHGTWTETVPMEQVEVHPEPHQPRRRWN